MRSDEPGRDLKLAGASALSRRRDTAAFRLNLIWYQTARARAAACALLLAALALPAVTRWVPAPRAESRNRPIPLEALTAARGIDRFNLEHKVATGDSISKISIRYYNLWSPEHDALLRRANPDLPADPRQLTTRIVVKVPLR